ncbi:hypothetical protein FIV42_01255 [Persicimonas caeni]|uniref:Uncharacterized protein n=1 Tax=Persicimonas caeni TaxID=2292766 RepID=A0A4Y6PM99_PERCE|nr:hypothetical protein [Persicimonas caeni]QDG49411.1 hypothetical protein FIV42_01255 [Persicimonas caeni]QED30632.1 hypothetical protein FRD00_01250 [Persicimonas caeni]
MLYCEETTGVVAAGYAVDTGGELTGAQAEEILGAVEQLNEEHGTNIKMIVPGDSATDHAEDPEMALYAFEVIFGVPAVMASTWGCPAEVSVEAVQDAAAEVEEAPEAFWSDLAAKVPLLADYEFDEPEVYLASFGPLSCAVLAAGVPFPSDDPDEATYEFFSVQDMNQEWLEEGVDGVEIAYVDFTDIASVDLSAEAVGDWLAKVDKLDDPKIYMTLRYD